MNTPRREWIRFFTFDSPYRSSAFLSLVLLSLSFTAASARAATIVVPAGGDVQAAINAAQCGDTIALQAGATFETVYGFGFPDKGACSEFITVTTTNPAGIPAALSTAYPNSYSGGAFTRITPAMAANMPKLVAVTNLPLIYLNNGAHHWKFVGLEITNKANSTQINVLVNGGEGNHHIIFDQLFLHPIEEVGDLTTDIQYRSVENAFIVSGDQFTWTHNAIQGFTGHNRYPTPGVYRINANSILCGVLTNSLIENNLLEANGQFFLSGGGSFDPAHVATATNVTYTSATFSNTTDLNVGDLFAIYDRHYSEGHLTPHPGSPTVVGPRVGHYVNGAITAVNHGTGSVTFTRLTGGLRYRQINLNFWGATSGTYTLTWQGQTTAPITLAPGDLATNLARVRAALEALPNVNSDDFDATFSNYADVGIFFGKHNGVNSGQWQDYSAGGPLLSYDSEWGSPMQVDGSNLVGGVRTATATVHSSESYTPLEGDIANPNSDVPDEGANVRWKGFTSNNVVLRRNIFAHHPEWTAVTGSVKGFAEIKGGTNTVFDGNIFSGEGTGIIWTVRNQGDGGSGPWSSVTGARVTNNLFDTTGFTNALVLSDGTYQNEVSHDFVISNNLFLNPAQENPNPWITLQNGYDVTISHNTVFAAGNIIRGVAFDPSVGMVTIKDNIFIPYGYVFPCLDGVTPCWPIHTVSNNLVLNHFDIDHGWMDALFLTFGPGAGWIEHADASTVFTSTNANLDIAGDYHIKAGSPYRAGGARQASDGKDLGVDFNQLYYAIFGVGTPPPPPPPTPTPSPTPIPSPTPTPSSTPTPTPSPTPGPTPGGPASATFVQLDGSTQGNWRNVYGADGHNTINDSMNYPSYAQVSANGQSSYTWSGSTSDVRGLQKAAANDRLAAAWYSSSAFSIDLNLSDGLTHQVALYCVDWDDDGRIQTVNILDASTNALLDSKALPAFRNGKYLVWNIKGHVKLNVTKNAGANSVVSGLYFGSATPPGSNPIDDAPNFVRWHYLDFLNREPDSGGWAYWAGIISSCPAGDVACIRSRRIGVSAAFFVELEFQQTGSFVYRFYKSSLGRTPSFAEFMPDRALVVDGPNLEANKQSWANAWVQRAEFLQKYPVGLSGTQFIDRLLQTVQETSGADMWLHRTALIDDWNGHGSRARIVRMVADMPDFVQVEYNPAFVLMQYFGYLRRDPDPGGYSFWLNVLNNQAPNNHRGMVCAFLTSAEYQLRFGAVVTHTNGECGP